MKKFLMCAVMAGALASTSAVHAVATQVDFGFVPIGDITYVGDNLGTSTSLTLPGTFTTNTVGPADDSGAFAGMAVSLEPLTLSYSVNAGTLFLEEPLVKTFTTVGDNAGLYTAELTTIAAVSNDPNFVQFTLRGTMTGPDEFSKPDELLVNCNQSTGEGAVNCSFTQTAPPRTVAEPAMLGMLGLAALLGVGFHRRSRQIR